MAVQLAPDRLVAGRYRLVREIGAGGMGAVWHAINETTNRDFAIKFLKPDVAKTRVGLRRFLTEAKICGSLQHPNVVEVFDVGTLDGDGGEGEPFLVMELLRGEPLDAVLGRERRLHVPCALGIARAVVDVLATAHAAGVVHRDLKPANLFLQRLRDGGIRPKVLDFGISKLEIPNASEHTSVGSVVGSPAYMSPEQAGGQSDIDGRADLWAVGAILYRCLSGRLPFAVKNYNATMVAIATTPAPLLAEHAPNLPADLCMLVDRCLSRAREARFADATALLAALDALIAHHGSGTEELTAMVRTSADPTPPRSLWVPSSRGPSALEETTADLPTATPAPASAPERGEATDTHVTASLAVASPSPTRPRRTITRTRLALAAVGCSILVAWMWTRSRPAAGTTPLPAAEAAHGASPSGLPPSSSVALQTVAAPLAAPSATTATPKPPRLGKPAPMGKPKSKPSLHEGINDPGL